MRVKCSFCDKVSYGSKDELIERGWNRAVLYAPRRMTITACPEHKERFIQKISRLEEVLGGDLSE